MEQALNEFMGEVASYCASKGYAAEDAKFELYVTSDGYAWSYDPKIKGLQHVKTTVQNWMKLADQDETFGDDDRNGIMIVDKKIAEKTGDSYENPTTSLAMSLHKKENQWHCSH